MAFTRYLKFMLPYMRGEDVLEAQTRLRELGFFTVGRPDGLFGAKTEEGVRAFQAAHNLTVDGIIGFYTWNALFADSADVKLEKLKSFLPELIVFHGFANSVRWRVSKDGVEIEGSGVEILPRGKSTVTQVWQQFESSVAKWSARFGVPAELIVATICTESSGKATAVRQEPGFASDQATPHKVSPGLMQTLISTARSALNDPDIDREWLLVPDNSIKAGTAYIASQWKVNHFDPPRVACAYNAGGIYPNDGEQNRWKMRQYPIGSSDHADRFVGWFNQFVAILSQENVRPEVSYLAVIE
jgi:hypothetical protein